jgi:hypothetical protein
MSETSAAPQPDASGAISPNPSSTNTPVAEQLDSEESRLAEEFDGVSTRTKLTVLFTAIIIVAVILGVWHDFYFHWFEVHSGTVNESGPYYGFWSGFGSDIGEATIFVGIIATWRHHNCHVKGCARLGRRVDGTPYLACPKHHPEHKGFKRSVSLEELRGAHKKAKEARQHHE